MAPDFLIPFLSRLRREYSRISAGSENHLMRQSVGHNIGLCHSQSMSQGSGSRISNSISFKTVEESTPELVQVVKQALFPMFWVGPGDEATGNSVKLVWLQLQVSIL